MGLTDISTLIVFALATFLITIGVALFWKHIFRTGISNLIVRTSLLILVQALALSTVGIAVNRSNGFFETWSDLFGSGTNYSAVAVKDSQLPHFSKSALQAGTQFADGSVMVNDVITGEASKVSNTVLMYLPASAKKSLENNSPLNPTRYRVVEFLTGFPSQPIMWQKVMKIDQELSKYNKIHKSRQIIGLFPQVNVAGNYDLECMNLPGGKPAAESWLTTDMRKYLERRIGVSNQKWSILGLSTGGWCAAMLAIKHPDFYDKAVSIAGYYRPALPLSDPISLQKWAKKNYDLKQFEDKLQTPIDLYLVASLGDKYSIKETKKFLALNHPMLKIKYRELAAGGHNPHVWIPSIKPALDWL